MQQHGFELWLLMLHRNFHTHGINVRMPKADALCLSGPAHAEEGWEPSFFPMQSSGIHVAPPNSVDMSNPIPTGTITNTTPATTTVTTTTIATITTSPLPPLGLLLPLLLLLLVPWLVLRMLLLRQFVLERLNHPCCSLFSS